MSGTRCFGFEMAWAGRRNCRSLSPLLVFALLLGGCGIVFSRSERTLAAEPQAPSFPVVAYVPEYRVATLDPAVAGLVTDLIFFSIEPKPTGELDTSRFSTRALEKLQSLRASRKIRLLVALGGWERSHGFPRVATDAKARARFVKELTKFCVEHKFDGADFDWEHPANAAENEGYAALLAEVHREFQPRHMLVTLTLADWQDPGKKAYEAADRIHVMAYDHEDPRHSTFEHAKADIEAFEKRGVPRRKICLGLPCYGRGVSDHNQVKTYAEIVNEHKPAANVDEVAGLYFNNIATIQRKTRFAKQHAFGGVMIWEIGQDSRDETSLLRAINKAVKE